METKLCQVNPIRKGVTEELAFELGVFGLEWIVPGTGGGSEEGTFLSKELFKPLERQPKPAFMLSQSPVASLEKCFPSDFY